MNEGKGWEIRAGCKAKPARCRWIGPHRLTGSAGTTPMRPRECRWRPRWPGFRTFRQPCSCPAAGGVGPSPWRPVPARNLLSIWEPFPSHDPRNAFHLAMPCKGPRPRRALPVGSSARGHGPGRRGDSRDPSHARREAGARGVRGTSQRRRGGGVVVGLGIVRRGGVSVPGEHGGGGWGVRGGGGEPGGAEGQVRRDQRAGALDRPLVGRGRDAGAARCRRGGGGPCGLRAGVSLAHRGRRAGELDRAAASVARQRAGRQLAGVRGGGHDRARGHRDGGGRDVVDLEGAFRALDHGGCLAAARIQRLGLALRPRSRGV